MVSTAPFRLPVVTAAVLAGIAYVRWLRPRQLHWGATEEEVRSRAVGDDLVERPHLVATRAVDVLAPPERVWPWLVQIGRGRAGWYSYDRLDNQGVPSSRTILPEHQHMHVGDVVTMSESGGRPFGPTVLALQPPHAMLWGDDRDDHRFTWLWQVKPVGHDRSRLVSRLRYRFSWRDPVTGLLMELVDPLMMRKAMLGIAERAAQPEPR